MWRSNAPVEGFQIWIDGPEEASMVESGLKVTDHVTSGAESIQKEGMVVVLGLTKPPLAPLAAIHWPSGL
jgi:hypothetical protein